jgi:hypothetical protein
MLIHVGSIEPRTGGLPMARGDNLATLKAALGRIPHHPRGSRLGALVLEASIFEGDPRSIKALAYALRRRFLKSFPPKRRPSIRKSKYFAGGLALAIQETIGLNFCVDCGGRGIVRRGELWMVCKSCWGMKRTTPREGARREMSGIPTDQWDQTWVFYIQSMKVILATHKANALRVVEAELGFGPAPPG